ncbi:CoA ester lyase [Sphingomonas spermidinifaciens]|uniref:CoA ester lyase n=1 Tax=Sphingomonas spermidinifaciens TaxID=1141889 RepID=A0A2A4B8P9_9SPHN|nr:CoA ester lyase [Sphingomonas spermidinifaciens]PCD04169.1 CoA ester lyase [Sphingomonas spermidinifaciens]
MRSLLFVPGDRPERFAKALASGADALILDLEDSVVPEAKARARDAVAAFLGERHAARIFVRVNPLGSEWIDADAEIAARADGIVLPKAEGAASVEALAALLGDGAPPILPIATETPRAVFALGDYGAVAGRLAGLTWGAEDLPAAIGAATSREESGGYTDPYRVVRALILFGAHAAGVPAIETVFPAIKDEAGIARYAETGARDGFTGMMAIHPAQVAPINAAFTPSAEAVEQARRIVTAFAQNPGAGALQLGGRMIDAPHLKQARALLARAG